MAADQTPTRLTTIPITISKSTAANLKARWTVLPPSLAPLFTADLVDRERNAVHSEYTAKIKEDGRRYFDALKQIINPEHPFSKFTVGNLETLAGDGAELAEEVRQFWLDTYSANLMALAVIGPRI